MFINIGDEIFDYEEQHLVIRLMKDVQQNNMSKQAMSVQQCITH